MATFKPQLARILVELQLPLKVAGIAKVAEAQRAFDVFELKAHMPQGEAQKIITQQAARLEKAFRDDLRANPAAKPQLKQDIDQIIAAFQGNSQGITVPSNLTKLSADLR